MVNKTKSDSLYFYLKASTFRCLH